jgi:hypothetical protein
MSPPRVAPTPTPIAALVERPLAGAGAAVELGLELLLGLVDRVEVVVSVDVPLLAAELVLCKLVLPAPVPGVELVPEAAVDDTAW